MTGAGGAVTWADAHGRRCGCLCCTEPVVWPPQRYGCRWPGRRDDGAATDTGAARCAGDNGRRGCRQLTAAPAFFRSLIFLAISAARAAASLSARSLASLASSFLAWTAAFGQSQFVWRGGFGFALLYLGFNGSAGFAVCCGYGCGRRVGSQRAFEVFEIFALARRI